MTLKMNRRPLHTRPSPTYPRWKTSAAQSVRRFAVAAASSMCITALGCAGGHSSERVDTPPAPLSEAATEAHTAEDTTTDPTGAPTSDEAAADQEYYEEWISLPARIIFTSGAELSDMARQILLELADILASHPGIVRVRVTGYIYPERETNPMLGLARAQAIVDFLVLNGISRQLFEVASDDQYPRYSGSIDAVMFQRAELSALVRRARPVSQGGDADL